MADLKQNNAKVVKRLLFVVVGMFAFGFAMVPLYDLICEVTGLNGKTSGVAAVYTQSEAATERTIEVQFVAHVKRGMPWDFKPEVTKMEVMPGVMYKTNFYAHNLSSEPVVGQAIPSVAPGQAALYFNKTECFCFNQQYLKANEKIDMPLVFFIDKDIPDDVKILTLSYSMFNITEQFNTESSTAP